QLASDLDAKAQAGNELLVQYTHYQKGMRKPAAPEFADALRQYPRARFDALLAHNLTALYRAVRESMAAQSAEVEESRGRMEAAATVPPPPPELPPGPRRLMTPGCPTVADAVTRFVGVLTDADLHEIDRRVQAVLEPEYGGLYQACLNSASGPERVARVGVEEARGYLEE